MTAVAAAVIAFTGVAQAKDWGKGSTVRIATEDAYAPWNHTARSPDSRLSGSASTYRPKTEPAMAPPVISGPTSIRMKLLTCLIPPPTRMRVPVNPQN